jgi:hypothetical protein
MGEPIIEALDDGNVSVTVRRIRGTSWEVLVASRAQLLAASGIKPAISRLLAIGLRSSSDRFLFLTMQSTRAFWLIPLDSIEEKRPMRRQPDDHRFWSHIMLAVMAVAFLLVAWVATKALFLLLQESPIP